MVDYITRYRESLTPQTRAMNYRGRSGWARNVQGNTRPKANACPQRLIRDLFLCVFLMKSRCCGQQRIRLAKEEFTPYDSFFSFLCTCMKRTTLDWQGRVPQFQNAETEETLFPCPLSRDFCVVVRGAIAYNTSRWLGVAFPLAKSRLVPLPVGKREKTGADPLAPWISLQVLSLNTSTNLDACSPSGSTFHTPYPGFVLECGRSSSWFPAPPW
jgi:hypothetical protein